MATKVLTFEGPVKWAKVFVDNRDMKGYEDVYVDCEGAYTIDVSLDSDQIDELKASGSMKKGSVNDDGTVSVKFVRKHKDRFEWSSGAPEVLDEDGNVYDFEERGSIGNGSICKVWVSVYTTSRPSIKGTRLDKVQVIKHVEYERD